MISLLKARVKTHQADRGSALLIVLIAMVLLTALGLGLVGLTNTEASIAANVLAGHDTAYAADSALERALADVLRAPVWDDVLSGSSGSSFRDVTRTPALPGGLTLDLNLETTGLQGRTDALWGAAGPAWRLFAHGPLWWLTGRSGVADASYVAVWVADDPAETDANPSVDANGAIVLLATAWRLHTVRTMTMTVGRQVDAGGTGGGVGPPGFSQRVLSRRLVQ